MPRRHSSDSDEIPLNSYKSRNLHKPDSLPCEFCDHISTSIYANFKHNATHIIIPLVNLSLHQCKECLQHFTSLEELTAHAKAKKHSTPQAPNSHYDIILQSIIKKQLVVKCHDLFNDIKQNGLRQNGMEVTNESHIENDTDSKETNIGNDSIDAKETNLDNDSIIAGETNIERGTVSIDNTILQNVIVKSEEPTYIITDSDSNGLSTPLSGKDVLMKEQRIKTEAIQTKPEKTYTVPETVTEILPDGNNEQNLLLHSKDGHGKWHDPSDSDSDSHCDIDAISDDSKMKFYHSDEEIREVDQSVFKYISVDGNGSPKRRSSGDYEPIRSRLVFEDDLDDDLAEEILPDSGRAIPYMSLVGTTNKHNSIILGTQTNSIIVKNKFFGNGGANLKILDDTIEYPESVPYEELMKTEICDCRYCGRCFCNRLQLITHETTHLHISKPRPSLCPYCERFYAGNFRTLRKHLAAKHPNVDPDEKRRQTQICKVCKLSYYNMARHALYYHKKTEENQESELIRRYRYRNFKLCDMCLNWCKNDDLYKLIGTHSKIGATQKCYRCKNQHFSINLVTRRRFSYQDNKRTMSNEDRLMRIKKKLKMIKQLNKCFCGCFICAVFPGFARVFIYLEKINNAVKSPLSSIPSKAELVLWVLDD